MNWITFIRSFFVHPQPTQQNVLRTFSKTINAENPYLEKYADKLSKVQKTLDEDIRPLHVKTSESFKVLPKTKTCEEDERDKSQRKSFPLHKQKELGQIMKLEAVQEKNPEEIASIWKQYHQVKEGVYAVLPGESYEKIHFNLSKYPTFLFPLPRSQGYEFIICQFHAHSCYFTTLINYQAYKENAPVILTLTYYTEFHKTKGIVLMRGEYDKNILTACEAQCLTNQLQLYYGSCDETRLHLVHSFNNNPEQFKHMELIRNFEKGLS